MNELLRMFVWQAAQVFGYSGRADFVENSILLLVDYEEDAVIPVFIGTSLNLGPQLLGLTWREVSSYLVENVVDEAYGKDTEIFLSEAAARRRFAQKKGCDATSYKSRVQAGLKWTHCIQSLFLSSDPMEDVIEKLDLTSFFSPPASNVIIPDLPHAEARKYEEPHLMSFFMIIEIDAVRRNMESLQHLARHDQLTGLYNRHSLTELVHDEPSIVVILDINKFKEINDTYGHATGDSVLCALTGRLESVFYHSGKDLIFRIGGDEFLVVVQDEPEEYVIDGLQKVCKQIHSPVPFSVSAGYAFCDGDFKAAMAAADEALYKVKKNGRKGFLRG